MPVTISCILPTANRGQILCDTIGMLLDQFPPVHEIIVVDQSKIVAPEIVEQMTRWADTGKITWMQQESPNASEARNRGAVVATGEVLLFLDDDIRIDSNFVANHARNYSDPACNAVAGQLLEGNGETTDTLPSPHAHPSIDWMKFPKNYDKRAITAWMISANVSVRRDVFFAVGGMDESYRKGAVREETDFAMRLRNHGYSFVFDPHASAYHLQAKGGARVTNMHIALWKHFFGHWYFILGHADRHSVIPLMKDFLRSFVLNRDTLKRPGLLVLRTLLFIAALPVAAVSRIRHCFFPRLIDYRQQLQAPK